MATPTIFYNGEKPDRTVKQLATVAVAVALIQMCVFLYAFGQLNERVANLSDQVKTLQQQMTDIQFERSLRR